MRAALLVLILMLAACAPSEPYPQWKTDQALRQSIFLQCMAALPKGPVTTASNDWAEVVSQCDTVAYDQSQVCYKDCLP